MMRVLVLGAGGLLGRAVVTELLRLGHKVTAVGPPHRLPLLPRRGMLRGGAQAAAAQAAAPWDAVVLLPDRSPWHALSRTRPRPLDSFDRLALVRRLQGAANRPKRLLFVSSFGAAPDAEWEEARRAWATEEAIRESGLEYVIFRPSWVFAPLDRSHPFARFLRLVPKIPVLSPPDLPVQPIALANLAEGIAKGVRFPGVGHRTYDVGGPHVYTTRALISLWAKVSALPAAQPWYITHPTLERMLPAGLCPIPPWITGTIREPTVYFRDFCIRPLPCGAASRPNLRDEAQAVAGPIGQR